jgi:hypothetical protein
MAGDDRARFVFGADDEPAFGLAWRQLPVVVAAIAAATAALIRLPSRYGVIAAAAVLAVGLAVAFLPVAGHRLDIWVPLWIGWIGQRFARVYPWRSSTPARGHLAGYVVADPPPEMAGVELLVVAMADGRRIGVAADPAAGVYSAVLPVASDGLLLASDAARHQRFAAWGGVLAAVARDRSPVHRLQWMTRTVPDDGAATHDWFAARDTGGPASRSYRQLLSAAAADGHRLDHAVSVSVSASRAAAVRGGRDARRDLLIDVLLGEIDLVVARLAAAGFSIDGAADPTRLVGLIRSGFDPFTPVSSVAVDDTAVAVAWPLATDASTRWYRADGAWHATYWVAQWPRTPVAGDFLAPLMLSGPAVRSISIIAEPIATTRAHRHVQRDLVSAATNDALRARAGFRMTAQRAQRNSAVARREHELAAGHEEYRVVGLLTVSGRTSDELEVACGQVEQLAQQAHLVIRRLWGRQPAAFAAAQPLALGLR